MVTLLLSPLPCPLPPSLVSLYLLTTLLRRKIKKLGMKETKKHRECLLCHACRGRRRLPWSRPSLCRWPWDEKCLHIGVDGWTDCLFVLWQIHSTCVTAVDPSPRWSAEAEIGKRDGGKRKAMRVHPPTTLSACLSPGIEIDIGRLSCCLFPADLHCCWRR